MNRFKQKNINLDGQQSLFDDLTLPPVAQQPDKQHIDKQRNKSAKFHKTIQPAHESITETLPKGRKPVFVVDDSIRMKFPFIRHQPASLMDYRNIVDIIVRDGNNEYWIGFDRHKNEILPGSFEKKIPDHLKESVTEYIEHLKVI